MPPYIGPRIIEKSNRKYIYPHKWSEVQYQDVVRSLLYYYWDFIKLEGYEKEKREYRRLWNIVNSGHPR